MGEGGDSIDFILGGWALNLNLTNKTKTMEEIILCCILFFGVIWLNHKQLTEPVSDNTEP